MEIKKVLSAAERVAFTETVMSGCTRQGAHEPAMYDYAFRFAVVGFLTDIDLVEMEEDAIAQLLYSDEVTAVMLQNDPLLIGLDRACREKVRMAREEWMVHYSAVVNPNPLERLVDLIEEVAGEVKKSIDPEAVMDAVLKGQDRKTAARKKAAKKKAPQLKVAAKPVKE